MSRFTESAIGRNNGNSGACSHLTTTTEGIDLRCSN